jgi:NAD(P)-dependent dehydrogenase (short-subunit alcohol dehydrogenase family)
MRTLNGRLKGRVAVVTGASSGIGRAIALALAEEGAAVVCAARHREAKQDGYDADPQKSTDQLITESGGVAAFREVDVARSVDVQGLIDYIVSTFGRLDIMVNNAGWFSELHTIVDETEEDHDRTMAVNEKGVWLGCKYAITAMCGQEPDESGFRGKVINVASVGGILGLPAEPAYCASKGAVVNLTRQLALDFGSKRIAVNAVAPGLIATAMVRDWLDNPDLANAYDSAYPWADRGQATNVARAVVYLASDESSYVHGAILSVDGGMSSGVCGN